MIFIDHDHYIYLFYKQLDILINLKKNKITMSIMIKDMQLLENYNKIWKKNRRINEHTFWKRNYLWYHDDKYMKIRIKTYKDSIITNFYNKNGSKKIPEEKVPHKCCWIIILDSVIYAYEKYYPQTFLEECKYAKEKIKTNNYIDTELESESYDEE